MNYGYALSGCYGWDSYFYRKNGILEKVKTIYTKFLSLWKDYLLSTSTILKKITIKLNLKKNLNLKLLTITKN